MESEWLAKARGLRADAWDAVCATPDYIAFKNFDALVVQMGGASVLGDLDAASNWKSAAQRALDGVARRVSEGKRPSQGDAAEMALRQQREPMSIGRLIEAAMAKGAEIGGSDPLANFRSAMSKDARFYTIRRDTGFHWWLTGEPLPAAWEGPGADGAGRIAQSSTSTDSADDAVSANATD